MKLAEFCSLIQPHWRQVMPDREVSGVAWDCRRVAPGNLFLALPTVDRDTQSAIDVAIERGASAILCEGREVVSLCAARIHVPDVRAALPRVAELFFRQPDRHMKVIGVVGNLGTSATAMLLKAFIEASDSKCGLIGMVDCEIGDRRLPPLRKNCESIDYHEVMAQMVRAECEACVIELTPEAIGKNAVAGIAFDVVVFGSMEGASPVALWDFCHALRNGPKSFVGAFDLDDLIARTLFESGACRQSISFGFAEGANVRGSEVELALGWMGMLISAGTTKVHCPTQFTGRQNAFNLLAAAAGALACRIPLGLVRWRVERVRTLPGSLEQVADSDVPVYVDGAKTEIELRRTLESLREITRGKVLLAFGSKGGESMSTRRRLGVVAATLADYTVITTDNPGREGAMDIAEEVERGFFGREERGYHIELDRRLAIEEIIRKAAPGDTVLIAGKGDERHQELADTIVPFDDREYVMAALEARGARFTKATRAHARQRPAHAVGGHSHAHA